MSVAINSSPEVQDRAIEATRQLCQMLDLGHLKQAELKLLAMALTEAVVREIPQNPDLAQEVKIKFSQLRPLPKSKTTNPKPIKNETKSIRNSGGIKNLRFDSFATLDPFVISDMVGSEQLPNALQTFSVPTLKQIAASIETPQNKKPLSKASKDEFVEYIVHRVMSKASEQH